MITGPPTQGEAGLGGCEGGRPQGGRPRAGQLSPLFAALGSACVILCRLWLLALFVSLRLFLSSALALFSDLFCLSLLPLSFPGELLGVVTTLRMEYGQRKLNSGTEVDMSRGVAR